MADTSTANEVLDTALPSFTFSSALTPNININHPFVSQGDSSSGSAGAIANWALKFIRPQLVANTPLGPVTVAPFGSPPYLWPIVAVGALALAGVGIYLLVR